MFNIILYRALFIKYSHNDTVYFINDKKGGEEWNIQYISILDISQICWTTMIWICYLILSKFYLIVQAKINIEGSGAEERVITVEGKTDSIFKVSNGVADLVCIAAFFGPSDPHEHSLNLSVPDISRNWSLHQIRYNYQWSTSW